MNNLLEKEATTVQASEKENKKNKHTHTQNYLSFPCSAKTPANSLMSMICSGKHSRGFILQFILFISEKSKSQSNISGLRKILFIKITSSGSKYKTYQIKKKKNPMELSNFIF